MKSVVTAFIVVLVLAGTSFSQDNLQSRRDAYALCEANMRRDPKLADKLCREYLEKYPLDDYQYLQAADKFVKAYEKVQAYAKALQSMSSAATKGDWLIFEPDLKINLPQVSETEGNNKIEIARSFTNALEAGMLAKAEAVYGNQDRFIGLLLRDPLSWAEELPEQVSPLWGVRGNDNVQLVEVVTASAVRYFYDLSISSREHRAFRTVFPMVTTGLKYNASIKHYEKYEHGEKKFEDVYVADLNLEWSSICGGLCGIGFTRNKLVVLDQKGEVVALFLDANVNRAVWVS
jgi:hypothetical protein